MNVTEQFVGQSHRILDPHKSACVMLDEQGQEVRVTQAMVVSVCQQLIQQCRNISSMGSIKN